MRPIAICAALALVLAVNAHAQSVLDRPPNLDAGWVAPPAALQFNFLHRFSVSPAPERKVSNSPTFLLGLGLPGRFMAGFNYATNSDVAQRYPNEWEFLGRWQPLSADAGSPLDATVEAAYNLAARSVDGALGLGRAVGPLRLLAEGRVLGDAYGTGQTRGALGAGGTFRLGRFLALAGDGARLLGAGEHRIAWGAGLQVAIPYTPHTLSLQATNTTTGTLQGASRSAGRVRYGFDFTIPVHLARFFGHTPQTASSGVTAPPSSAGEATHAADTTAVAANPGVAAATPAAVPAAVDSSAATPAPAATAAPTNPAPGVARENKPAAPAPAAPRARASARIATMHNVAYLPAKLEIAAGTTVVWTNKDPVPHSIVADDGSFDSGLIQPGGTWRHTFTRAGKYPFHCAPHPFMRGELTVR